MALSEKLQDRIDEVLRQADNAFWKKVVEAFPEITSGDVTPVRHLSRLDNNRQDVETWVEDNLPKPYVVSVVVAFNDGSEFEIQQSPIFHDNGISYSGRQPDGSHELETGILEMIQKLDLYPERAV